MDFLLPILTMLLGLFLSSLIVPLLAIPIIRMVCLFKPKYLDIYPNTLYALAICWVVGLVSSRHGSILMIIGELLKIVSMSFFIGTLDKPDSGRIGFIKGLIITLIFVGVLFLMVLCLAFLIRMTK